MVVFLGRSILYEELALIDTPRGLQTLRSMFRSPCCLFNLFFFFSGVPFFSFPLCCAALIDSVRASAQAGATTLAKQLSGSLTPGSDLGSGTPEFLEVEDEVEDIMGKLGSASSQFPDLSIKLK